MKNVLREGWAFPTEASKAHYFVLSRSLCKKWIYRGVLDQGADWVKRDHCVVCHRERIKRIEKQEKVEKLLKREKKKSKHMER